MNRIFITGASGFVGSHLIEHLFHQNKYQIFGSTFGSSADFLNQYVPKNQLFAINLLSSAEVGTIIQQIQPTHVVHLAALSSPAKSNQNPLETLTNNIGAQINLFESLLKLEQLPKVLVIGSAEEYGLVEPKHLPIDEKTPFNPTNPYAVSKITQDYLGLQYFYSHNLPVIRLRPFNHTGERHTSTFVLPAFAKQIAEIEAGQRNSLVVEGDLEVERDFTDVKDMVRAYELALSGATAGDVYNIGSGKGVLIADLLSLILSKSSQTIKVEKDPAKQGNSKVKSLICNYQKFQSATGWYPQIPLEQTVERVLNYWRQITKEMHVN